MESNQKFSEAHLENMFKRYLVLTVRGIRADYYKSLLRVPTPLEASNIQGLLPHVEDNYFTVENPKVRTEHFKVLGERDRYVLDLLFCKEYSQVEVGRMLGISQQAVFNIKHKALSKLRKVVVQMEGL